MPSKIGKNLKVLLAENEITQKAFSKMIGVKQSYLSRIITGDIARPSAEIVAKMASAINVPINKLFDDTVLSGYILTGIESNKRISEANEANKEITRGLLELLNDHKAYKLMSITQIEFEWMRSIRFRYSEHPTKQDFIDLLFVYRNIPKTDNE